jgi:hypothetical protein
MRLVRELEAWSSPGRLLSMDFGKDLQPEFVRDTGLPVGIFLGLTSIPDQIHVSRLAFHLEADKSLIRKFDNFCEELSFPEDTHNLDSACRFLEHWIGRPVAWLHIPDEGSFDEIYQIARAWVRSKGLIVVDPDTYCCLL